MLIGTDLAALGRRHSVRRADHNDAWPARCRTVVCVLLLAVAAASCGVSKQASTSPPSHRRRLRLTPALGGSRCSSDPSLGSLYYGSPAWKETALTCSPHDDALMQCIAQTLDSDRVVLAGSNSGGRDKYILGPVVFDGSDVLRAVAVKENGGFQPYWLIDFTLTAEAARTFADATREAVGRQIAIIVDGQVVSAPTVQAPIPNGQGAITCACDEERAKALAAQLNGSA